MQWSDMRKIWQQLATLDNVVGVGEGKKNVRGRFEHSPALTVLVRKKVPISDLRRGMMIPRTIGGCITDVIEVGEIKLHNHRTGYMRPAKPGVSIGHYKVSAGTFGAVVYDKHSGEKLILSNNHVLANLSDGQDGRCVIGDKILQPGSHDGGNVQTVIATLERFVPLYKELVKPVCPWARCFETGLNHLIRLCRVPYRIQVMRESEKYNVVDCAVARPINVNDVADDILEVGWVAGVKEPQVSMAVKKSGRSSGVTHSIIMAVNVIVKVALAPRENAVFERQVLCGPMSLPGDSGSLVLTDDNYAVGLLFAGSELATVCNRLDCVCETLNITLTPKNKAKG